MEDGVLREHLAVLGSPIAHSKSPAIHAAAYAEAGVDWDYGRFELQANELEGFLAAHSDWRGFSLTMPLKEEAYRLAAVLDPVATESGVVNTLLRIASGVGEEPRWAGFNTDVGGLAQAVQNAGLDASRTVVLGAGATAVSAVLAAGALGAERGIVLARRPEAASALADRYSEVGDDGPRLEPAELADPALAEKLGRFAPTLVISTLPGPAGEQFELPDSLLEVPLFDVAYAPWPSPLAERWATAGGVSFPGTDMLVEQALLQVRIFLGGDPSIPLQREDQVLKAMRESIAAPRGSTPAV